MDIEHTWGPRYFQIISEGDHKESRELGSGEYALVIDKRYGNVSGTFSLEFIHQEYTNERFSDWGLALIEAGASMSLLGLALSL